MELKPIEAVVLNVRERMVMFHWGWEDWDSDEYQEPQSGLVSISHLTAAFGPRATK